MKSNRLTVQIIRPVEEVFAFTINPENTPKWVDSISLEQTNEWPIKIGSVYRNQNKSGEWSEYEVTALEPNKTFELMSRDWNYHVRYSYKPVSVAVSEMEYFEWVDDRDLENPLRQETLSKLKFVMENRM